jgi:hypothetical protein
MLKWFVILIMGAVLFITGAFYGIDKNNEKLADAPTVKVREQEKPSQPEGQCRAVTEQEDYPWIVEVAGGIGEGVSATFNGILLVLSEMIHSSSA